MENETSTTARLERQRRAAVAMTMDLATASKGTEAPIAVLQETLCRAAFDYLGCICPTAYELALKMIERLGVIFDDALDAERAVEAFGQMMCIAARLVDQRGMSIEPIITLAIALRNRSEVQPMRAPAALALAVTTHGHAWRTHGLLVEAVALCIAKGLDDCETLHELRIDPVGVFVTVANEEIARDAPFPAPVPTWDDIESERKALLADAEQADRDVAAFFGARVLAPGVVEVHPRHAGTMHAAAAMEEWHSHADGLKQHLESIPASIANTPRTRAALERLQGASERLDGAERAEGRGDFAIEASTVPGISFDPEAHVNHSRICPLCSGLLSYCNGTEWKCSNEACEFKATDDEMAAMLGRQTRPRIDP